MIINQEETPEDEIADLVIHGKVGYVLPTILSKVKPMSKQ